MSTTARSSSSRGWRPTSGPARTRGGRHKEGGFVDVPVCHQLLTALTFGVPVFLLWGRAINSLTPCLHTIIYVHSTLYETRTPLFSHLCMHIQTFFDSRHWNQICWNGTVLPQSENICTSHFSGSSNVFWIWPKLVNKGTRIFFLSPCSFWLISHRSTVLFSQNKPTNNNQPTAKCTYWLDGELINNAFKKTFSIYPPHAKNHRYLLK
jgi:hypothetical protein